MDMIEVDPKLFVTCRLCLEEIGVYQIVPEVQKKIKYCFDLHISLFDGLPQLICKKCECMLRNHALTKEMLHEKQKSLLIKLKGNIKNDTAPDERKPMFSINQKDAENEIFDNNIEKSSKNLKAEINKDEDNSTKKTLSTTKKSFYKNIICDGGNTEPMTEINKCSKSKWRKKYNKQYVCKYCSLSQRHRANIILHSENCVLMQKYSHVVKWCWVNLQNINFKPNLTDSRVNVVWEKNKIINSENPNYYILYSLKTQRKSSSESSDENFTSNKKKRKRRRIMSESSTETLVLDTYTNKENSKSNCASENNIECVTLDDSDNASTLSVLSTEHDNNSETSNINDKNENAEEMIMNTVSLCNNKYLKNVKYFKSNKECVSLDDSDNASKLSILTTENDNNSEISTENAKNEDAEKVIKSIVSACNNKYFRNSKYYQNKDSFLQRKLLSMGRKIIHKEGFNPTGLLRYMEQKDLDFDWIEKTDTNVSVRTTFEEKKRDLDGVIWKSYIKIDNDYKNKDFIDNFEKLSASEADSTNSMLVHTDKVNTQDGENVISSGMVLQKTSLVTSGNDSSPSVFSSQNSNNKKSHTHKSSKNNKKLLNGIFEKNNENNVLYIRPTKESEKTMLQKLLNASPVPNPKKLNIRNGQDCQPAVGTSDTCNDEMLIDKEVPASVVPQTNSLHMPIITSTVSLAPNFDKQITFNEEQCPSSSENNTVTKFPEQKLPRIKVKPDSELMAKAQNHPKGIAAKANVWAGNPNENQNVYLHNIAPKPQLKPVPVYMSFNGYQSIPLPQIQAIQLNVIQPSHKDTQGTSQCLQSQGPHNIEYIIMHTTELPKTRTASPFQYFKDLLKIHHYELLINVEVLMSCIVKFKLVFEQGDIDPVTLSLLLFCDKNMFCIQVKDLNSKLLDVNSFSAHWQWEILKGFKSDVVNTMFQNAKKFGQEMFDRISYFILLLNTIVVSRC